MSEWKEASAEMISTALEGRQRMTLDEICTLLGDRKESTAEALAWLLVRGAIRFVREDRQLYIGLPEVGVQ
jgi:hypothetical protein